MDLKNLEKRTLYKCEICGGYHPEEEMEQVTIIILKGKKCDINNLKLITIRQSEDFNNIGDKLKEDNPFVPQKKAAVIPPQFKGVFGPPPSTQ